MALVTLGELKQFRGIPPADHSKDNLLEFLAAAASEAAQRWCRRRLERATVTEFYDGHGGPELALRRFPVASVANVWLDPGGHYGQGEDAFAAPTLLTAGKDYALVMDGDGGAVSASGVLVRLGVSREGWIFPRTYGVLTPARVRPVWDAGEGNLKVEYTAGYDPVPDDVRTAVCEIVAWVLRHGTEGGKVFKAGESLGDYSYTLAQVLVTDQELGSARGLLAPYRRPVV